MMASQKRWILLVCTVMLAGVALGGVLMSGSFGLNRPGGNAMHESRFMVDHVRLATDKPFAQVKAAFERGLGKLDPEVLKALGEDSDPETARAKIEAMAGPSGFMLFGTSDHGALLLIAGQKRKAVQYIVGNPLIAVRMTQHNIRAGLYAPLRVLPYENEEGKTCLEYDKPSSLFGQFANAEITTVAAMLDQKLEALAAEAMR
jgi:uncharacterized protein (DUF302 family)